METPNQTISPKSQFEQIRDQQKATWDQFAPGWKKWDNWVMNFLKPVGDEIIRQLLIKQSDVVLDVATGTGEPGLTIASMANRGSVTGPDLSPNMLEIARENAIIRGINNYTTVECDVSALPFPDNSFDKLCCRFGFMFFPDMQQAANEMARVLKPGGKIATSVWGPADKNFWITSIMGPIMKNMTLPVAPPGSPGMFRCAEPAVVVNLFKEAGLKNVTYSVITEKSEVESIDVFWQYMNEVAAPVVSAMNQADEKTKVKIKKEVFDGLQQKSPGNGPLMLELQALVIYGEK